MYLTCDARSYCRRGHVYARKGDRVSMVRRGDDVCIVQLEGGSPFPIHVSKLSAEEVAPVIEDKPISKPDARRPKVGESRRPVASKNQQLF